MGSSKSKRIYCMFALLSSPCYPFKKQAKVITLHSITITVTLTEKGREKWRHGVLKTLDWVAFLFGARAAGREPGLYAPQVCGTKNDWWQDKYSLLVDRWNDSRRWGIIWQFKDRNSYSIDFKIGWSDLLWQPNRQQTAQGSWRLLVKIRALKRDARTLFAL